MQKCLMHKQFLWVGLVLRKMNSIMNKPAYPTRPLQFYCKVLYSNSNLPEWSL